MASAESESTNLTFAATARATSTADSLRTHTEYHIKPFVCDCNVEPNTDYELVSVSVAYNRTSEDSVDAPAKSFTMAIHKQTRGHKDFVSDRIRADGVFERDLRDRIGRLLDAGSTPERKGMW